MTICSNQVQQWHNKAFADTWAKAGQATYPCNTHTHVHLHMDISIFFQNMLYYVLILYMQDIYPSYSNDQSSGV